MYVFILAGGSGTRLWPLSRELFPKQYLSLPALAENDEESRSLFEATFDRVTAAIPPSRITVVTHRDQAGEVRRQLNLSGLDAVRLIEEPRARNTAPAIGLAAFSLRHEAGDDAVMAVLPSDHLIRNKSEFAALLEKAKEAAAAYGLVTFGIKPTYPETGYGYIRCGEELEHSARLVDRFVEKPDLKTARSYLEDSRYLWNSGMFVFQVKALLEEYRRLLPAMYESLEQVNYDSLDNLDQVYPGLEKISIDYAILERAEKVTVIPTAIDWSDLGSWEAYYQVAPTDENNNYLQGYVHAVDTEDSLLVSTSRLVGAAGLKNLVVVETADALMVCDRKRSQDVKKIVERLQAEQAPEAKEHRTAYRPWGSYTSLELAETYQVKRINVSPGSRLSLQSHRRRSENWIVVTGEALVTVDDDQFTVKRGERAYIPAGARHRMENRGPEPLVLIEVQTGDYLGEDDIERYEDDYGRAGSGAETKTGKVVEDKAGSADQADQAAAAGERNSPGRKEADKASTGSAAVDASALDSLQRWLAYPGLDPETKAELEAMKDYPVRVRSHFGSELVFGTGGMRGLIGPGQNRINRYIIARATQGLADYLARARPHVPAGGAPAGLLQVAIACDTRHYSDYFAEQAALVLAANGIKALLFAGVRPTPLLSYTVRELGCAAGIVITASHNPPAYNGYKVYGPDGGQAVSPLVDDVVEAIAAVDIFEDVRSIARFEAEERGLIETVEPAVEQGYLERVRKLSLDRPREKLKVVYTPLHGTGGVFIPGLLSARDFVELYSVEEQADPDPDFSTVRVPNPEDPAALDLALEKARRVEADLVLATDPDGDRVGTAVLGEDGRYVILSGNQVGALLLDYICSRLKQKNELPAGAVMVKTIVTGNLGLKIAESYGVRVVETLTGFKFIGEKMKEFKEMKGGPQFVFGYEESCGYLTGTFVRDKDAVISSYLLVEMAAHFKERGQKLIQVLDQLQARHGFFAEDLVTVELKDISEADRHVAAFHDLPPELGGMKVVEKRDYEQKKGFDYENNREFELTLPRSPVLHYTLAGGSWFAVRPSGTEPKVKFYFSATASTAEGAKKTLARLKKAVLG